MKRLLSFTILTLVITLSACGQEDAQEISQSEGERKISSSEESQEVNAISESDVLVELKDTDGQVVATASLIETETGVNIAVKGEKLPPGLHGFHIHEKGICEPPDFESAGGHFNPTDKKHGFDHPEGRHAGDLENIEVAEDGTLYTEVMADMVTLEKGKENSLFKEGGTALVIHSDADDYLSQPSGDAGSRIACGVIK
ncbi:superoxide dismutase family protein [Oceanobacillus halophilus]|uniref:Superoxide dismutase [Cu-Zn] n=1 Tax=Oceanobacillus halophilus TaxID=930130 RepID=A0A495A1T1_9BACI|nr:superoxide dismutase family protein [Oceanobacillus halophilus]RKQ33450.1 superoxide dismutase family protein [Oceanobacillus halophilus]